MGWIGAELLKYKRTFTAKLIIFIPAFFAVYAIATGMIINSNPTAAASGYTGTSWLSFLAMIYNWWPVLFLPLGMGIFAGLADSQERKAGRYRALCSHDISPFKIWVNKVAGMAVISFLSTVILIIIVIATGLFAAEGTMPLGKIFAAGLLCWFTSLALIPFQLWTAAAGGDPDKYRRGISGVHYRGSVSAHRFLVFMSLEPCCQAYVPCSRGTSKRRAS